MRTDRLDPGVEKVAAATVPPRSPASSSLWVQSATPRWPYERAARKEGRKAKGTNKGGNWTNQFTVFEIRLPRSTGPWLSGVQRVQGCVYGPNAYRSEHSWMPRFAMPLLSHSTTLILFYCWTEIKRCPLLPPSDPLPTKRANAQASRSRTWVRQKSLSVIFGDIPNVMQLARWKGCVYMY